MGLFRPHRRGDIKNGLQRALVHMQPLPSSAEALSFNRKRVAALPSQLVVSTRLLLLFGISQAGR